MSEKEIIQLLELEPLPGEGGFYRQTYKSKKTIPHSLLPEHEGSRVSGTAIYYLVTKESFSSMHLVPQDELFHFYMGDPVQMLQISQDAKAQMFEIGTHLKEGQRPQVLVPGGVWQGTRLKEGGNWALLGCTVTPGFEFSDFQCKSRDELCKLFPQHQSLIERFTYA